MRATRTRGKATASHRGGRGRAAPLRITTAPPTAAAAAAVAAGAATRGGPSTRSAPRGATDGRRPSSRRRTMTRTGCAPGWLVLSTYCENQHPLRRLDIRRVRDIISTAVVHGMSFMAVSTTLTCRSAHDQIVWLTVLSWVPAAGRVPRGRRRRGARVRGLQRARAPAGLRGPPPASPQHRPHERTALIITRRQSCGGAGSRLARVNGGQRRSHQVMIATAVE